MRVVLKVVGCLVLAVALAVSVSSAQVKAADANPPCPTNHCSEVLDGWVYVGPCTSPGPCLGWIYRKGSEECHKPALGLE